MWDEYKQENFNLRALLFVTINNWAALSNLSGHSNKGYKACTHCLDDTDNIWLTHYSGKDVFDMVKDLEIVFGKGPGSQPIPTENGMAPMWMKKSIFWELPY